MYVAANAADNTEFVKTAKRNNSTFWEKFEIKRKNR